MSILKKIGFALIGKETLATMNLDTVQLTRTAMEAEQKELFKAQFEQRFFEETKLASRQAQLLSAVLFHLTGSSDKAYQVIAAANTAEQSGEGFMKKKAAVLKVVKELGLSKSQNQLVIELAVQLIK